MQAGLDPSLTPHAMRHTFATLMLDGGADLRSVQELLGHESLSTTQIYTHLSIDRLKQATLQAHPRSQTKPRWQRVSATNVEVAAPCASHTRKIAAKPK